MDGRRNNGGRRANSGRKKLQPGERKVLVGVFTKQKNVNKHGGLKATKRLILNILEGGKK